MTYGVLLILLILVIFLIPKLMSSNFKNSTENFETDLSPAIVSDQLSLKEDSPEKIAQWVLKKEKTKAELKQRLCTPPSFSDSKFLFGRDETIIELFHAINKGRNHIELYGRSGVGKTALALEIVKKYKYNFQNINLYLDFRRRRRGRTFNQRCNDTNCSHVPSDVSNS